LAETLVKEGARPLPGRVFMCDSDNHQGYIVDTSFTRRSLMLTMSSLATAASDDMVSIRDRRVKLVSTI